VVLLGHRHVDRRLALQNYVVFRACITYLANQFSLFFKLMSHLFQGFVQDNLPTFLDQPSEELILFKEGSNLEHIFFLSLFEGRLEELDYLVHGNLRTFVLLENFVHVYLQGLGVGYLADHRGHASV